jgi:hypothetical protein
MSHANDQPYSIQHMNRCLRDVGFCTFPLSCSAGTWSGDMVLTVRFLGTRRCVLFADSYKTLLLPHITYVNVHFGSCSPERTYCYVTFRAATWTRNQQEFPVLVHTSRTYIPRVVVALQLWSWLISASHNKKKLAPTNGTVFHDYESHIKLGIGSSLRGV